MCNKCDEMDIYVMENGTDDNSDVDSDEDADDPETDASDQESCESHDEYEGEFKDGDIVWGKYGRTWYPGRVCAVADLPNVLASRLRDSVDLIPLKWYGENNFSLVHSRFVDILSQNRVDEARASGSNEILLKYNEAVCDLRND